MLLLNISKSPLSRVLLVIIVYLAPVLSALYKYFPKYSIIQSQELQKYVLCTVVWDSAVLVIACFVF